MASSVFVIALLMFGSSYATTPTQCNAPEITNGCGIGGVCVVISPTLSKCSCYQGYHLNFTTYECADVNECIYPNAALCRNGRCLNTEGSYKCRCQQGYVPHFPDGKSCARRQETGFFGMSWYSLAFLFGEM